MLVGYNTNISYKDKIYHIQTEDSGQNNPLIVTLLFSKGAILASKRTSYAHIIDDPDFKEKVGKLMRVQHKSMIKELLSGKYTGELKGEEKEGVKEVKEVKEIEKVEKIETQGQIVEQSEEKSKTKDQITKSLDDILLNYIMKRTK